MMMDSVVFIKHSIFCIFLFCILGVILIENLKRNPPISTNVSSSKSQDSNKNIFGIGADDPESSYYINSRLFEGDIIPTYDSIHRFYGQELADELVKEGKLENNSSNNLRGTFPNVTLWNTIRIRDKYIIPIFISKTEYSDSQNLFIKSSLLTLAFKSGVIEFEFLDERPQDGTPFISIGSYSQSGCSSYIGRIPSFSTSQYGQKLMIGSGCFKVGIIQHEVLHALGFFHEQARPDRDNYVDINYENIDSNQVFNFQKSGFINSLGSPYDYESIMHYSEYAFSNNGEKTLSARGHVVGNRVMASKLDIEQIRLMYQCSTGPRNRDEYKKNKCTTECKCAKNWKGCNNDNTSCQKGLICRKNKCVKQWKKKNKLL